MEPYRPKGIDPEKKKPLGELSPLEAKIFLCRTLYALSGMVEADLAYRGRIHFDPVPKSITHDEPHIQRPRKLVRQPGEDWRGALIIDVPAYSMAYLLS